MVWRLYHARALSMLWCALACPAGLAQARPSASPIRNVIFEHVTALTSADEQGFTQLLQQEEPSWVAKQSLDTLSKFIKNAILSVYQNRGYWRARLSVEVTWVRGNGASRQVDVLISALDEGAAYSLKEIRLTGATVFSQHELQGLIPLHPPDRMSRAKVEQGLEAMRELYASRGYIAFAAIPHTELDDQQHTVVLDITLREDSPFRFGNLSTEGLDRTASRQLRRAWDELQEQIYSQEKLSNVLARTLPVPPGVDPLDYSVRNLDFDTHTVDVHVSLPPATQAEKTAR